MRDKHQLRCYRGMKLAAWLTHSSYWQDTMTQRQVEYLVTRVLNHPEVYGRWNLEEVDLVFPTRGSTAWASKLRPGYGRVSLPPGTRSPLIVLHEVAHLLAPTKKEEDHGPGFVAIHLMLVDLFMSPDKARILAASYDATGTPSDPSRIPANAYVSTYVPIIGGANLQETVKHLGVMLSSGLLEPDEAAAVRRTLKRLKARLTKEPLRPMKPIPDTITIPTRNLLRANTAEQVAEIVLSQLRDELLPKRMVPPPKPKKTTSAAQTTSRTTKKPAAARKRSQKAATRKVR